MRLERVLSETFPATREGLAKATQFLETALENLEECPMASKTKLLIVHDEIASNIVRYSGARTFTLAVSRTADPAGVQLVFTDDGCAYNPLAAAAPDVSAPVEKREIGGLGIFMVRKMVDTLAYARESERNVLTLHKLG